MPLGSHRSRKVLSSDPAKGSAIIRVMIGGEESGAASEPIPVVWCVDIEPFHRQVEEPPEPHWRGVLETMESLDRWRPALQDATGEAVRFSWFWRADPQVEEVYGTAGWGLSRYKDLLDATLLRGDAHGIHPHFWRRDDPSSAWIEDFRDPRWVEHCVRVAFAAFEAQVGSPPLVNRCGDRRMDSRTARLLGRLGIRADLSVEPGVPSDCLETNVARPDYTAATSRPYRPAANDFNRPRRRPVARDGLTMLPLTTRSPASGRSRDFFHPWDDSTVTTAAVDALLADDQRYLAFAIRSDGPLAEWWTNVESLLDHLRTHPLAPRFVFATPIEALSLLNGRHRTPPQVRSGGRQAPHTTS